MGSLFCFDLFQFPLLYPVFSSLLFPLVLPRRSGQLPRLTMSLSRLCSCLYYLSLDSCISSPAFLTKPPLDYYFPTYLLCTPYIHIFSVNFYFLFIRRHVVVRPQIRTTWQIEDVLPTSVLLFLHLLMQHSLHFPSVVSFRLQSAAYLSFCFSPSLLC